MASRKSSKMTTTQRRQNLLRSVTEVRTGRMTTNGLFRLGPQTMTEVSQQSGRVRKNAYFIVRNDLRDILEGRAANGNVLNTYYNAALGRSTFRVNVVSPDTLSIGCKTFTGKAAAALKAWALQG